MENCLEDEDMTESEQTALYELLDATVKDTISWRIVNERKAPALTWVYDFLIGAEIT
jgi:hypothetical protein